MRVLLTTAPAYLEVAPRIMYRETPPLVLYTLASQLTAEGHEVVVLDPVELMERLAEPATLPGFLRDFGALVLSANSGTWPFVRLFLEALEGWQDLPPVVLGGIHPTLFDRHVLETTPAHFVVRGEGERTLPELLAALEEDGDPATVAGVSWASDGTVHRTADRSPLTVEELTESPLPDLGRIPRGAYFGLPVESSRGCRFRCVFCSIAGKGHWRGLPAQPVVDRVRQAVAHLDRVRNPYLFFVDDCFTADRDRLLEVLGACGELGGDFEVGLEARATDLLAPDVVDALAGTRLRFLQIGVECGHAAGLRRIKKGLRLDLVREAAGLLRDRGLIHRAKFSYIVGFPWETPEMMGETIRFAYETAEEFGGIVQISWLLVFPGSEIWEQRAVHGIDLEPADFDHPHWQVDPEIFARAHPSLAEGDRERIAFAVGMMRSTHPGIELHGTVAGLPPAMVPPPPAAPAALAERR